MTSPCRQGLFLGLNSDPCPCGGKAPDHELLQGNKKEAPAAPLEDLCVSGTGGGRGGSSHRPTHLCFQKQEGNMKKGREVGGSENSRGAAGLWVFIIYRLLFTVYCSIERTSKRLYGKKKIERNKHKRNADENFMQQNEDARETFSIWCFNGRQPGAYGQSSLMLLFCFFCFLRRGTVPPYCYRLFITAPVRRFSVWYDGEH